MYSVINTLRKEMRKHKVATVSLNQTPMDWDGNEGRLFDALKELQNQNVDFACFPEMVICGYAERQ